ncbi:unnamed protein product [Leuciscus chuanchicus]
MARLPQRCVMISVCLAGTLLLLPLCWGLEDDQYNYDYDSTHTPEYDYNSTFGFFSNASSDVLEKFLMGGETDAGEETNFTETDGSVYEQKPTAPTVNKNQASRSTPVCSLLTLVLVHQLLRLL